MCGRVVHKTPLGEIRVMFETVNPLPNLPPGYNAAPTDTLRRPGQSGNPSGHSGEYGVAVRLARQGAPMKLRGRFTLTRALAGLVPLAHPAINTTRLFASSDKIRRELVTAIRRHRPHVVITFDPDGVNLHPDHVAISQFTTAAMVAGEPLRRGGTDSIPASAGDGGSAGMGGMGGIEITSGSTARSTARAGLRSAGISSLSISSDGKAW